METNVYKHAPHHCCSLILKQRFIVLNNVQKNLILCKLIPVQCLVTNFMRLFSVEMVVSVSAWTYVIRCTSLTNHGICSVVWILAHHRISFCWTSSVLYLVLIIHSVMCYNVCRHVVKFTSFWSLKSVNVFSNVVIKRFRITQ